MIVLKSQAAQPTPTPTLPTRAPKPRLGVFLTGADGSTWDLRGGPVMMQPSTTALTPADAEHSWSEPPVLDGAVHRGYRVPQVTRTLPVLVMAEPGMPFVELDGMFGRALHPGADCVLTSVAPNGRTRTIPFRFNGVGDNELEDDPVETGIAPYDLSITYYDPFWRGTTSTTTFRAEEDLPTLFEPRGQVENLVPANTTGEATVANDGDVASFPVYGIGPCGSFEVGFGDSTVAGGPVAAGEVIWIDTHPLRQTVGFERGGNDEAAWLRLTKRRFAAIPPGSEVPIVATFTDPGEPVQFTSRPEDLGTLFAELTPRYRRPW